MSPSIGMMPVYMCRRFAGLKRALTTAPVLVLPDPKVPFELITDSCGYGVGAVLMQGGRPVALYSRKMTKAEMNYVNHEQELLAVIASLRVFRCYLLGEHFTLVIDNMPNWIHNPLCPEGKLAGVSNCNDTPLLGFIGQASVMLLTL